jgi:DNA-binding IclR family transcriptional regulator
MSSSTRVFAILSLFSKERPVWQPDEINEALGYSRPTGYRYVKDLVDAGMLQKVSAGRYALGARIIELDYQLRQSDPVLLAAMPIMAPLAARSSFDAVLSVLYAGPRVIDIHRASGETNLELVYGRGRPRPMFRSGAPKVLLAGLPRAPLVKIYESHAAEIAQSGMGATWGEFRAYLTDVRRKGYYRSNGELQVGVGALAVPVLNDDDECLGALALVGSTSRLARVSDAKLHGWLTEAVARIRSTLKDFSSEGKPPQPEPMAAAPARASRRGSKAVSAS